MILTLFTGIALLFLIASSLYTFGIIRGQTATASIIITPSGGSAETWTNVFQSARVRYTLPQVDATTYSTETNGNFIAGIERATFDFTGLMVKGQAAAGPIVPSAYQGATVFVQYDSGCSISATANATDGEPNRPAGAMGVISATFVSTGTITTTWSKS